MYYVITFLIGVIVGGICMSLILLERYASTKAREKAAEAKAKQAVASIDAVKAKEHDLILRGTELEIQRKAKEHDLNLRVAEFDLRRKELDHRIISYDELQNENTLLRRDLQNIDVNLDK